MTQLTQAWPGETTPCDDIATPCISADATVRQDRPQPAPTGVGLLVRLDGDTRDAAPILIDGSETVIGRDDSTDVTLTEPGLSRRHARFERREDQFIISDLGSTNGSFVNYAKVESAVLYSGDRVQLGNCVFKFLTAEDVEARLHDDLIRRATRDPLTGAFHRGHFNAVLADAASRPGFASLILCDLDHFKQVNDQHGHLAGDEVLKETVRRLETCIAERGTVARYGGEELAVLPGDFREAAELAVAVQASIRGLPYRTSAGPLQVTVSVGYAVLESPVEPDSLIAAADSALYQSKANGRDRVTKA